MNEEELEYAKNFWSVFCKMNEKSESMIVPPWPDEVDEYEKNTTDEYKYPDINDSFVVVCLNNDGFEDSFEVGIEYICEGEKDGMMRVIDMLGEVRVISHLKFMRKTN